MAYIYDLTDTWSAAGTVFNGIKLNVTNTASAAASKLITLQIGGTEHFSVTKAGVGYFSGNVGIGTSSPSTRLDVNSTVTLSGAENAQLRWLNSGKDWRANTSAGGNWYLYDATNNKFPFTIQGNAPSDAFLINSSGNVGIGTSSPDRRLSLYTTDATGKMALFANGNTNTNLYLSSDPSSGGAVINVSNNAASAALPLLIQGNGAERMRIDSSGNVGIGTSAPTSRLTITGGTTEIRDGNYLMLRPSGNGWDMRLQATSTQLDILSGGAPGSPIMSLVNGGNVGIGTSSPTTKLQIGDISAADATYQGRIKLEDTSASLQTIGGLEFATSAFGAGYGWKINSIDSSGVHLAFGTRQNSATWSEAMRIGSSGSLLVGTTAPMAASGSNEFKITSAGVWPLSLNGNDRGLLVRNSSASSGFYAYFEYNGGTNNGSISWSGGTTAYNTTSDYRLKEIDGPITNSGAYIDALKPVEGWWKADGKRFIGFLAHQVQEVSQTPVVVGEKDGAEMQQMDYSAPELIANLIAEVQSLRARVAQLEGN